MSEPRLPSSIQDEEPVYIRISGWNSKTHSAQVHYEGHTINRANIAASQDPVTLKDVRKLELHVHTGNDERSVCGTQDALFALISHITPENKLASIEVNIDITTPGDGGNAIFSCNYGERMHPVSTMQEFRGVSPGDLSRAHLAAFLLDQIRMIRNVHDGPRQGRIGVKFVEEGGTPWLEIPRKMKNVLRGSEPVPDSEVFSRYFGVVQPMLAVLKDLAKLVGMNREYRLLDQAYSRLRVGRVRGDLVHMKSQQDALLRISETIIGAAAANAQVSSRQDAGRLEVLLRKSIYSTKAVQAAFPHDADVSVLGYNEADARLALYQADKKGFVAYGSRAKRKDDSDGVAGKKWKGNGGGKEAKRRRM